MTSGTQAVPGGRPVPANSGRRGSEDLAEEIPGQSVTLRDIRVRISLCFAVHGNLFVCLFST